MRTLEAQAAAVAAVRTGTDVAQLEAALQDDDEVAAADGIIAEAALADESLEVPGDEAVEDEQGWDALDANDLAAEDVPGTAGVDPAVSGDRHFEAMDEGVRRTRRTTRMTAQMRAAWVWATTMRKKSVYMLLYSCTRVTVRKYTIKYKILYFTRCSDKVQLHHWS